MPTVTPNAQPELANYKSNNKKWLSNLQIDAQLGTVLGGGNDSKTSSVLPQPSQTEHRAPSDAFSLYLAHR